MKSEKNKTCKIYKLIFDKIYENIEILKCNNYKHLENTCYKLIRFQ